MQPLAEIEQAEPEQEQQAGPAEGPQPWRRPGVARHVVRRHQTQVEVGEHRRGQEGDDRGQVDQLRENLQALLTDLNKLKPSAAKGVYMKKITVSTTMGPGLAIDQTTLGL